MFLVKCECGCFYTLQENSLNNTELNRKRTCPNCGSKHDFDAEMSVEK